MKRHLFFTGPAGWGKTAVIRQALGASMAAAGGFITQAAYDTHSQMSGQELLPAAAALVQGFEPLRFLSYTPTPATDNEVFRHDGVRLLREAEYYPFAVLDQIGGFELIIPQFRQALAELLSSDLPCIGAIMSYDEAQRLRKSLGLGEKYIAHYRRLLEALADHGDSTVYELRQRNDETAHRLARQWTREYAQ